MKENGQNEPQIGSKSRDHGLMAASYHPRPQTKAALTDPSSPKILPLNPPSLPARIDQRFPRKDIEVRGTLEWAIGMFVCWFFPPVSPEQPRQIGFPDHYPAHPAGAVR